MDYNFKTLKPRCDRKLATSGLWQYPVDEAKNEYGGFLVGAMDGQIPRVRLIAERAERAERAAARTKRSGSATEERIRTNVEIFVDACLLDWDLVDADGKAIPFSREAAVSYFTFTIPNMETGEDFYPHDYAFANLWNFVHDLRNYQSEEQNAAGDSTKN